MSTPVKRIDLRYRGDKQYPPPIAKLVEKYKDAIGPIGAAERAAGVSIGLFGKIRNGAEPFTRRVEGRVKDALARPVAVAPTQKTETNNMSGKPEKITIPETCPPVLAELIRFKGSKASAIRSLGTSDGPFYLVLGGKRDIPPAWIIRAKTAMGQSVIEPTGTAPELEASAPQAPPFVPWDRKTKITVSLFPKPGHKKGRSIKVPEPLGRLINMHENMNQVAMSMGHTPGALTAMLENHDKFSDKWQRKVHRALHGLPPENAPSMGEEFDKYSLGIAICMVKGANFARISEIAEILMAKMVFRKNTKGGWIIIYRMADEDLPKFKRLALRDAEEIVCP